MAIRVVYRHTMTGRDMGNDSPTIVEDHVLFFPDVCLADVENYIKGFVRQGRAEIISTEKVEGQTVDVLS